MNVTAHLTLTATGLQLKTDNGCVLHLQHIHRLTFRTEAGLSLTLTPHTRDLESGLVTIPGASGQPQHFHPLSEGAPLADYIAYVMSRPDIPLPLRLRDLRQHLLSSTAASFKTDSTLHTALERDPRFQPASERGHWTLTPQAFALLNEQQPTPPPETPTLPTDLHDTLFELPSWKDIFRWTQCRVQHPDGRSVTLELPHATASRDLPLTLQLAFGEQQPPHPLSPPPAQAHWVNHLLQVGDVLSWQGHHPEPIRGTVLSILNTGQVTTPRCMGITYPDGRDTATEQDAINLRLEAAFPTRFFLDQLPRQGETTEPSTGGPSS